MHKGRQRWRAALQYGLKSVWCVWYSLVSAPRRSGERRTCGGIGVENHLSVHMPAPPCAVVQLPRPPDVLDRRHAHCVCLPPKVRPQEVHCLARSQGLRVGCLRMLADQPGHPRSVWFSALAAALCHAAPSASNCASGIDRRRGQQVCRSDRSARPGVGCARCERARVCCRIAGRRHSFAGECAAAGRAASL